MKPNLKKMLLALMVGFSLMGAVSVQAQEKVWVRVGDFCNYNMRDTEKVCGDSAALCKSYVAYQKPIVKEWPGVIINDTGRWYRRNSTAPLVCEITSNSNWNELSIQLYCPNGGVYNNDRPDGCYESRDNCPEGTVKGEGNVCVVPCTGIGEDGTASPKGCVPVNAKECDEKRERYKEFLEGSVGFVSCNKERFDSCSYESSAFKDPEARKYARECTFVHEYTHIINREIYEPLCVVYDDLKDDGIQGYSRERLDIHEMDEKAAYIASARCLLEKRNNCTNQACKDQLGLAAVIHGKEAGLIR